MPRDTTEQELDKSLATYTDTLLAGKGWTEKDKPPLAETVDLLARNLNTEPVPVLFRHSNLIPTLFSGTQT